MEVVVCIGEAEEAGIPSGRNEWVLRRLIAFIGRGGILYN